MFQDLNYFYMRKILIRILSFLLLRILFYDKIIIGEYV